MREFQDSKISKVPWVRLTTTTSASLYVTPSDIEPYHNWYLYNYTSLPRYLPPMRDNARHLRHIGLHAVSSTLPTYLIYHVSSHVNYSNKVKIKKYILLRYFSLFPLRALMNTYEK